MERPLILDMVSSARMQNLNGRVAVITGAGSGIGRGVALAFADAGAHVVAADIHLDSVRAVAAEVESRGVRALAVEVDVSQRNEVEALAERAYEEFGAVNVLCNNAGVLVMGPAQRYQPRDWDWVLSVNLMGVVHGIQSFLPRMIAQPDDAHIVNTSSLAGLAPFPGFTVYTTAKFAVAGLTEALRFDCEPLNIGVSLLCPGEVNTEMINRGRIHAEEAFFSETRRRLQVGLDPLDVGRRVLEGVRRNDAYILTNADFKPAIEGYRQRVCDAFDRAANPTSRTTDGQELSGRVAVITGGGSGIGRGLALAFADEGMHVVLADIEADAAQKVADEVRSRGARALALEADVTQLASMEQVAEQTYGEFGAAHVLCNNAGVFVSGSAQDRTDEDWLWCLGVNLRGVIHGIQAFLPRMLEQGEGHIINTASIVGLMFPLKSIVYGTSKHALIGLTASLAMDLQADGIKASVICPGGVRTRITSSERNRPAELAPTNPDPETDRIAADAINAGMDPLELGRRVVAEMRRGELFIFPQPDAKAAVVPRFESILAAFDEQADRDRAAS